MAGIGRGGPARRASDDRSNGYEAVASRLIAARDRSRIGVATVREWARGLPSGASILDLGCGHGVPISAALWAEGFVVYGVDASPRLVAEFRARLPRATVACEAAEESSFFERSFDGIVAIGLVFLLSPPAQRRLLRRIPAGLEPGGRFLFTAPKQRATWTDLLTDRESISLGDRAYRSILREVGLRVEREFVDEGDNHYYDCARAPRPA